MKPSQFILAFFVAAMFETTCATGFERESKADVDIPGTEFDTVHPSNALRRAQVTMDLPDTELDSFGSTTGASDSATSTTTETEAPTIMVLLPDSLAQSYSGSGSVMFFDGAVDDDDKVKDSSKSAGSDTVNDETSNAASVEMATAVTAFTILFAFVMA